MSRSCSLVNHPNIDVARIHALERHIDIGMCFFVEVPVFAMGGNQTKRKAAIVEGSPPFGRFETHPHDLEAGQFAKAFTSPDLQCCPWFLEIPVLLSLGSCLLRCSLVWTGRSVRQTRPL